ncbi:MAG TPA: L-seryl-tRNA(Sec) selenium transferase [candidate division Zixibacteria bacterium]|nr:L-seryl-tRNA(Sec) selenium transferase [candidate division Zixibacteria bacterium]
MAKTEIKKLRDFPAIEELLQSPALQTAISEVPRPIAAEIVKQETAAAKEQVKAGQELTLSQLHRTIERALAAMKRAEITRVINATGIVIHTNLGRAPLPMELFDEVKKAVTGYGNIEFDLHRGVRGKRGIACEKYLASLAGAEAACVVNNNAAALLLILNSLANRREVVVSRGELVQIGGGFRIPDIMRRSGARLCEVGTTNITNAKDYLNEINERTALILKVHKSNFIQAGFTEEADLSELVRIGREHGVAVVNDLGSGVLISTRELIGYDEPSVQNSVRAGADLTCFSGDKMLGGVQAGLIVGRTELVNKIKRNPLFRTVRVDKIIYSMLEKLFTIYLNGRHDEEIKLWAKVKVPESELYKRGKAVLAELGNPPGLSVEATDAFMGGGSLPESAIPSVGIVFSPDYNATGLIRKLREQPTPIIGRIQDNRLVLDIKTVDLEDLPILTQAIRTILK